VALDRGRLGPSVPMMIAVVMLLVSAMFSGASRTAPR